MRKLGVSKFRTFRKSEGTDRLLLNINVDAELAPAFNWNVKQLFAFVVAEYETETHPVNQASVPIQWPCIPLEMMQLKWQRLRPEWRRIPRQDLVARPFLDKSRLYPPRWQLVDDPRMLWF